MKKLFVACLFCTVAIVVNGQVNFTAHCKRVNNNQYLIELNGTVKKGWRIYTAGDSALNLVPFSMAWSDNSIKAESIVITEKHTIKDALFENKLLEVADQDFTVKQLISIDGTPPSTVLLKIKGFAASKESFVPIDQTVQIGIEGGKDTEKENERILKLGSVDLNKPLYECGEQHVKSSLWLVFLKGFSGGLLAMLMPCIFPMIPVTISVFTGKSNGLRNSIFYGLSIIFIYMLASLPFHLISGLNPQILNSISTNATVNLVFFFIFIAFALSLFGVFEIGLPAAFGNTAGNKGNAGSLVGIFFMALTLCIISFSCTGPILGFLLASSIDDGAWPLTVGMSGFGLALALPFSLFALFPGWLKKLPKSGDWMDLIKKAFAFIELALALKFLSNADLVKHWGLLKRETFIGIWMALSLALGIFLLAKASGSLVVAAVSLIFLLFTFYLGSGLAEQTELQLLSGFPPPVSYSLYAGTKDKEQPVIINDYPKAVRLAKEQHKPILIDFTGWACVNCRKMEENVWSKPLIKDLLAERFVLVSLYVDDRKKLNRPFIFDEREIATVGDQWATFQSLNFKQSTQPLYVILNEREQLLNNPVGYTADEQSYKQWLECGLHANKMNQ